MKTHHFALAAMASACMLASGAAQAQDFAAGSVLVRARAVHMDSANKDSTGLGLAINNKTLPEVDFSYFFSSYLSFSCNFYNFFCSYLSNLFYYNCIFNNFRRRSFSNRCGSNSFTFFFLSSTTTTSTSLTCFFSRSG